jgi:ribosomal protein L7/L12
MLLQTKTVTEVTVYMNGDSPCADQFSVNESDTVMYGWATLMAAMGKENKVKAIKMFRSTFDCGLREAKAFVEDAMRSNY